MFIETLAAVALMSAANGQERAPALGGGQERVAPRGDYRDSCSGEYVNRGRLYADCRTRRGDIRGTSIELNRCGNYEIRNNDGLLVCGPGFLSGWSSLASLRNAFLISSWLAPRATPSSL